MDNKQICSSSRPDDAEYEGSRTRKTHNGHDGLELSDETKDSDYSYSSESWLPAGHYDSESENSQTMESDNDYTGKLTYSSKQTNQQQQNPKRKICKIIKAAQYKYPMQEVEQAVNLLNAKDTFFDNPHKFEDLFCLQNIYKNDRRNKSMVTLSRLCDEARKCLENRDWEHLVLVILRALQCPKQKTLMENFVLMEILHDPAIKNSEIAKHCLSLIFPKCRPKILFKKLTVIPDSSTSGERHNRRCSR